VSALGLRVRGREGPLLCPGPLALQGEVSVQLIHIRLAPLVLLEQEVLLVGAGRAVLQKQSKLVLNLRWQKRK